MDHLTKDKRMWVYDRMSSRTDIFCFLPPVMEAVVRETMPRSTVTIIVGIILKKWNRTGSYCAH